MLPEDAGNSVTVISEDTQELLQKESFQFDFVSGDFNLIDGKLVSVSGLDALKVWIQKIIKTEKFNFKIYSQDGQDEYGVSIRDLITGKSLDRDFLNAELKRELDQALCRNALIESTSNYRLEQVGRQLKVTFQVNLVDNPSFEQVVNL
ncbi:DUF2634 domain-containing protein [Dehalobacter sp. TeCB1]|uniref:DUF2634 domain-containing protein n=1 Tax=Dehalobacter sp. TeCB1 TaxID=1843715 RepID=UPI00083B64A5|nr:DUF2634 domain-containing protein [Dehalobacter sp. TeCB1]OCZ53787.1 hypothetical protein A7D23_07445 [Dehalobacter sp. TeCB1]